MSGPVLYRRSPEPAATARAEGHGRSRPRRARRTRRWDFPALPGVVRERAALVVLVVALVASLLTSTYLVTLIS